MVNPLAFLVSPDFDVVRRREHPRDSVGESGESGNGFERKIRVRVFGSDFPDPDVVVLVGGEEGVAGDYHGFDGGGGGGEEGAAVYGGGVTWVGADLRVGRSGEEGFGEEGEGEDGRRRLRRESGKESMVGRERRVRRSERRNRRKA